MKAIYRGRLRQVEGDDGDGLILAPDADGERTRVPYASADLVVDPTDDEVAEAMHMHVLGEEVCLVAHFDGDPGPCRRCQTCQAWLRPRQWTDACPGLARQSDGPPAP